MELSMAAGINDIVTFGIMLYLFCLIFEFRISRNKAMAGFIAIGLLFSGIYLFVIFRFPSSMRHALFFFCLLLPSLIYGFTVSKYRDFRFWFTFCTADTISFCINIFSATVFYYTHNSVAALAAADAVFFCLWYYLFGKARPSYKNMLKDTGKFWTVFGVTSFWLYIVMYFLERYPRPLRERPEYLLVLSVFGLTVQICYLLIFYAIVTNRKYQDNLDRAKRLEVELKLQDRYQTLAYMDEMTGLGNRRALMEKLQELEKSRQKFCYVMMDLNGLKDINDTYGHSKGDEFIQKGAGILKQFQEHVVGIYRVGGDEFVLLFSGCGEKDVERHLQQLRKKVHRCFTQDGKDYGIAMGYAWMEDYTKETVTEIMCQGDERMYADKAKMKEGG
ncbi:MAG: GGDEF domain-containing protein [Blautia sp.]|jgi:diguanylate cyclase (GGDEF)-like protein